MESIPLSYTNGNIQPMLLRIDGEITEELVFLSVGDHQVGILNRLRWNIVQQPEPSIPYYVLALLQAMHMGAVFAVCEDDSNGVGYIVPICCILEHGIVQGFGQRQQILLPLHYWNVFLSSDPSPAHESPITPEVTPNAHNND